MAQSLPLHEGDGINRGPTTTPCVRQMTKRRRHPREQLPSSSSSSSSSSSPPTLLLLLNREEEKDNDDDYCNHHHEDCGECPEYDKHHRGRGKVPSSILCRAAARRIIPLATMALILLRGIILLSACSAKWRGGGGVGDDDDGGVGGGGWPAASPPPGTSRYGPPTATSNELISLFERALLNDDLGATPFVPLVLEGGKLLCRRGHKYRYARLRTRFFVQMIRSGLLSSRSPAAQLPPPPSGEGPVAGFDPVRDDGGGGGGGGGSLPILVMDGDENGCNVVQRRDEYQGRDLDFPRLAWSTLNHARHGWRCRALSMPSYETWKYYRRSRRTASDWERAFEIDGAAHPWSSKIRKAVWRGSTTYEGHQYHASELGETPRGRLVKIGMERRPELFDVAFHKINQKFASRRKELASEFRVDGRISPMNMMKYMGMYARITTLIVEMSNIRAPPRPFRVHFHFFSLTL